MWSSCRDLIKDIDSNWMWPHVITFESNQLSNAFDVTQTIDSLKAYDVIERGHDTTLKLNLNKLPDKKGFTQGLHKYYITQFPANYDVLNLPHDNTLEAAQAFCIQHHCAGVTLQDGIYQVRGGPYLQYFDADIYSWVFV